MRPRASSFHVGLRWCALAWVCALGMVTFTQQAHAQARSPKELLELVSQGDQAALRRSLEEDPPPAPGLFYSVRSRAFYEPRMSLAAVLGDNQLKLKLARAYLAAVPDWVWAQHRMRTALQDIGDLDGAIEMGEQMRKARHMLHAHEQVFLVAMHRPARPWPRSKSWKPSASTRAWVRVTNIGPRVRAGTTTKPIVNWPCARCASKRPCVTALARSSCA